MSTKSLIRMPLASRALAVIAITAGMAGLSFGPLFTLVAQAANDSTITVSTISDPISGPHGYPFDFSCPDHPLYNPVTVSGSAFADASTGNTGEGQLQQYHVQINWGDASTTDQAEVSPFGSGHGTSTRNFIGTHTYATATSSVTITVSIYHVKNSGGNIQADFSVPIQTCVFVPPHASITVVKNTVGGDGTFDFTATGSGLSNFSLTTTDETARETFTDLSAGSYSVSEDTLPDGWVQTSATCTDQDENHMSPSSITLASNGSVICAFKNTVSSSVATLTLIKHLIKDNGGTAAATEWTLSADGPTPISGHTGDASVTNATVDPGTYTLSESGGSSGYTPSDWSCDGATVTDGDQITLASGDNATCTITNDDQPGTLIVKKLIVGNDSATPDQFSFQVNGGDVTAFNSPSGENDLTENAGSYTVTEAPDSAYTTGYDNCTNVVVPNGGSATCTITNTFKTGKIVVVKDTIGPDGGSTTFGFTANYGSDGFTLHGGESNDSGALDPNTYSVSETSIPAGWDQTSAVCDGEGNTPESIAVTGDATVTCRFTNTERGSIKVTKTTHGGDGTFPITLSGDASADAFVTTSDGAGDTTFSDLKPGSYSVIEDLSNLPHWKQVSSDCGELTVTPGQETTCTIDNEHDSHITVTKTSVGGVGVFSFTSSDEGIGDFDITTTQQNQAVSSFFDVFFPVDGADVSVSETVPAGWSVDHGTCSLESAKPGDTPTCTFTDTKLQDVTPPVSTFDANHDHQIIDTELVQLSLSGQSTDNVGPAENPKSGVHDASMSIYQLANAQTMDSQGFLTTNFANTTCSDLPQVPIEIVALSLTSVNPLTVSWDPTHQTASPLTLDRGVYCAVVHATDVAGNVEHTAIAGPFAYTFTPPSPPPPPPPSGGGGGGGGGPLILGIINGGGAVLGASTQGQVLGESCGLYMNQHLRQASKKNNPGQVTKLQAFLNKYHFGTFNPTGYFGPLTLAAVKGFQTKYADAILKPWNLSSPTGLVYLTTLRQLNLIECPALTLALPSLIPWSKNPNAQ